jgi:molybdate transport system substrate-binding protein
VESATGCILGRVMAWIKAVRALAVILFVALTSATYAQQPAVLHVAAAADLQPVLPAMARSFEKANNVRVEISFGASGTLTMQINGGAPFDVFLAADMGFPARAAAAGHTDGVAPRRYAQGVLVLWARKDSVVQPLTIDSLRSAKLKRLAIANPQTAPYGRAAMAALDAMGLGAEVKSKLVTAENIAQAAQFAESGNADAGLISKNSAVSEPLAHEGSFVVVPSKLYPPIEQGAVVTASAADKKLAHAFIDAVAKQMLTAAEVSIEPAGGTVQH